MHNPTILCVNELLTDNGHYDRPMHLILFLGVHFDGIIDDCWCQPNGKQNLIAGHLYHSPPSRHGHSQIHNSKMIDSAIRLYKVTQRRPTLLGHPLNHVF